MQESQPTKEHKGKAPANVNAAILTMSDSRTIDNDESGKLIQRLLEEKGHKVLTHVVIKDDAFAIKEQMNKFSNDDDINVVITNGGTGLSSTDVTIETITPMFDKEIIGFHALFMTLGYKDVGTAVMLSRSTAGIINKTVVFCLPGNPQAVRLGVEKIIIPEVPHIVKHALD